MTLDAIESRIQAHLGPVVTLVDEFSVMIVENQVDSENQAELINALRAALAATPQVSVLALVKPDATIVSILRNRPGMPAKIDSGLGDKSLESAGLP